MAKLGLNILETPVAIAKDVVTLGGAITERDEPYTVKKLKDIGKDYEKMKDSLDS